MTMKRKKSGRKMPEDERKRSRDRGGGRAMDEQIYRAGDKSADKSAEHGRGCVYMQQYVVEHVDVLMSLAGACTRRMAHTGTAHKHSKDEESDDMPVKQQKYVPHVQWAFSCDF